MTSPAQTPRDTGPQEAGAFGVSSSANGGRTLAPPDPDLWTLTAVLAVGTWLAMALLGWRIVWPSVEVMGAQIAILYAIGVAYRRRAPELASAGYSLALLVTLALILGAITYVAATVGPPFQDAALRRADHALGFSWSRWQAWLAWHPRTNAFLDAVYALNLISMVVAAVILGLRQEATRLIRAFVVSFPPCLVGLWTFPALGHIPTAPSVPVRHALRAGTYNSFDLTDLTGIVSMPSHHAVLAVLVPLALWDIRPLRWPLAVYGAVMLVATVSAGGHYLVDVIAGALLGVASWRVTRPADG